MVVGNLKYVLVFLLSVIWHSAFAQGHLSSEVQLSKNKIYVGQPTEVTVSVYTSTWFTKGVDPGNIKVNGAFTVYFRSLSTSKKVGGKTYAGVKMIYNVFPYDDENLIFPSLEIKVETPDEGKSKGIARIIKTKEKNIVVQPVPPGFDRNNWMVSKGVSVNDNWNGDLKNVKVGDVLERSIAREVQWMVAELIPPVEWDTISGVSLYPSRSEVNNNKTKTSISASRIDAVKYLFEKEGEIVIPEIVFTWWNPQNNKLQKRTLKELKINVLPNPDLGILESIRDSLSVLNSMDEGVDKEKTAFTFLGMSIKQLILGMLILVIIIFILFKIYGPIELALKERKENYINSELYYYRKFQRAIKRKDISMAIQTFYRWLDQIHLKEPSIQYFVENFGSQRLMDDFNNVERENSKGKSLIFVFNEKLWNEARNNYLKGKINSAKNNKLVWINP